MGVHPIAGWFIVENPILKWDNDWGYPYFRKPPNVKKTRKMKTMNSDQLSVPFFQWHIRMSLETKSLWTWDWICRNREQALNVLGMFPWPTYRSNCVSSGHSRCGIYYYICTCFMMPGIIAWNLMYHPKSTFWNDTKCHVRTTFRIFSYIIPPAL